MVRALKYFKRLNNATEWPAYLDMLRMTIQFQLYLLSQSNINIKTTNSKLKIMFVLYPSVDEILASVIAMYDNDGLASLPSSSEVLLCSDDVSLEQVHVFTNIFYFFYLVKF